MKHRNFIASLLCFTLLFNQPNLLSQELLRKITTDIYQKLPEINTANTITNRFNIEKQTNDFKKASKFKKVVLPLVFHIISKAGEIAPDGKQVLSQIDALNRDFDKKSYKSKHKADTVEKFNERVTDSEIQFCLASLDPVGKPTSGINMVSTNVSNWAMSQDIKSSAKGGWSPWNPNQYINIWVANLGGTTSGYAQMPGGSPELDGIVIDWNYLGTLGTAKAPYNQGKTLTHLIGNYLNLYDLWGSCYCCDDGVEDTPIHNAPNYGTTEFYRHLTTCDGISIEMSMNFMDNTNDDWMYMFTNGQKLRMQATLSQDGPRKGLVNNNSSCAKKIDQIVEGRNVTDTKVFIYPNPAKDFVTIEILSSKDLPINLSIYNSIGQSMHSQKTIPIQGSDQVKIKIHDWPTGIYHVHLQQGNYAFNQKLIVH